MIIVQSYQHTLEANASAVHPVNGNVYLTACVKEENIKQHLNIYRLRPGAAQAELIHQFRGGGVQGAYAKSQITSGSVVLRQDGALVVAFSAVPVTYAGDNFVPCFEVLAGIDTPWAIQAPFVAAPAGAPIIMNPPSGFKMYGGTPASYLPSADGTHWFAQCAAGPRGFGLYVFQQANPTAVAVEKPYGTLLGGRGVFQEAGNGQLFITGSAGDSDTRPRAYPVVGFKAFGNTLTILGGVGGSASGVDQNARDLANAAASKAQLAVTVANGAGNKAAEAMNSALGANKRLDSLVIPAPVSDAHIADIAWAKANDFMGTKEFYGRVKAIAQEVLLDSIEYAKTATAATSRLRGLIEAVASKLLTA